MRPAKTDLARDALRTRSGGLGAIERHVLIVSNGERTREEIVAMLGSGAQVAFDRLCRDGFLHDAGASAVVGPLPHAAAPAPASAPAAAAPLPVGSATASRRSVVAAKLYMLDMLQLQRGTDCDALAAALRGSREPADIARNLAAALEHLRRVAAPSYSARVAARLSEVAPPELLALMECDLETGSARAA